MYIKIVQSEYTGKRTYMCLLNSGGLYSCFFLELKIRGFDWEGVYLQGEQDTSSESEGDFSELPRITVKKEPVNNKESTKISIADFYAEQDGYSDEGVCH